MLALIQRVSEASVSVDGARVASIGPGVLALIGVERGDGSAEVERMADRLLKFRLFADGDGRMNLDIRSVEADLMLVPQFTLAADTDSGHRPSFSNSAPADEARGLFDALTQKLQGLGQAVATGRFGAEMQVALVNEGPVTFSIRIKPPRS